MRKTFILITLAAIAMAACTPTTQLSVNRITLSPDIDRQARAFASLDLIDPDSTRLRSMRAWQLSNGDIAVCGEQNARNRFGGYVGFQPLYLRYSPGSSPVLKSLKREFLAQTACGALDGGRGIPVAQK